MRFVLDFVPLLIWTALWTVGGWSLSTTLFCLRRNEGAMVGLAMGLILEAWLANAFAHFFAITVASWLAAIALLLAGVGGAVLLRRPLHFSFAWRQWGGLAAVTLIFTLIGRGLAIFDDYQNLPTVSLMATGDVPPHFALDPSLNFGYHYFLLLFSAQLMRLGSMFPWTALDLARGVVLGLPLILAGLWGRRLARNGLVGFLTACLMAFAGGARWLLLLLPPALLARISESIQLIGSASTSAANLRDALLTNWKIDGAGPIPFPFAFYTGINQPYVMAYTGIAGSGILILLVLLLIANRSRHSTARLVVLGLLAALAIANEIAFLLLAFGSGVVAAVWILKHHSWRLPAGLVAWMALLLAATAVAAMQGGLLTEMVRSRLLSSARDASYFDTSVSFVWPPAIVSAHLGSLSLVVPAQLVAALAEIGPIILVTPLVLAWLSKTYRLGRWYEASLLAASAGALLAVFMEFKGPLFTAWPRLMSGWFLACILYSAPLAWIWARQRSTTVQAAVLLGGAAACLSGLVLFGIQLLAIQRPALATFISPMDAKMAEEYWDRLDPQALVFDPVVYRAPTVFGRFTASSPSWYTRDPRWEALAAAPEPRAVHAAGFEYMYFGRDYWESLSALQQSAFNTPCVRQIAQVDGIHSEKDYSKDFRRLLDIHNCK